MSLYANGRREICVWEKEVESKSSLRSREEEVESKCSLKFREEEVESKSSLKFREEEVESKSSLRFMLAMDDGREVYEVIAGI